MGVGGDGLLKRLSCSVCRLDGSLFVCVHAYVRVCVCECVTLLIMAPCFV